MEKPAYLLSFCLMACAPSVVEESKLVESASPLETNRIVFKDSAVADGNDQKARDAADEAEKKINEKQKRETN